MAFAAQRPVRWQAGSQALALTASRDLARIPLLPSQQKVDIGQVAERLNAPVSKTGMALVVIVGSNPTLSA